VNADLTGVTRWRDIGLSASIGGSGKLSLAERHRTKYRLAGGWTAWKDKCWRVSRLLPENSLSGRQYGMATVIFTNGAFLKSVEIEGQWHWIVTGFEDDSFKNGELFNPPVSAESEEALLKSETEDDEEKHPK
jgi:hypothetical protein